MLFPLIIIDGNYFCAFFIGFSKAYNDVWLDISGETFNTSQLCLCIVKLSEYFDEREIIYLTLSILLMNSLNRMAVNLR